MGIWRRTAKYGMTSRRRKKFGMRARRAGFSPFVLRRSTTEETVDKSNLGPLFPSSTRSLQQRGDEERNGKAGFNYFLQNKEKRNIGGYSVGRGRLNFNAARKSANLGCEFQTLIEYFIAHKETQTAQCGLV